MAAGDNDPRHVLGGFIRAQRQLANLSLRQLSALTDVSNPYLSQIERGLHEPSIRVLRSIAEALNVSADVLFQRAGVVDDTQPSDDRATVSAILADRRLSEGQRQALLSVYRSYVADPGEARGTVNAPPDQHRTTTESDG